MAKNNRPGSQGDSGILRRTLAAASLFTALSGGANAQGNKTPEAPDNDSVRVVETVKDKTWVQLANELGLGFSAEDLKKINESGMNFSHKWTGYSSKKEAKPVLFEQLPPSVEDAQRNGVSPVRPVPQLHFTTGNNDRIGTTFDPASGQAGASYEKNDNWRTDFGLVRSIGTIKDTRVKASFSSSGGSTGGSSGWSLPSANNNYALPATLTRGSAELKYFSTLSGALAYLDSVVKNDSLKKEYSLSAKKLEITDYSYYAGLDRSFAVDYNRVLNAFVLNYVRLAKSKSFALTAEEKADVEWADQILQAAYAWCQRPESRYVDISPYGSLKVDIYRTKLQVIKTPLVKFEKKYVGKFDALLRTSTINEQTYRTAVSWWNGFVLHLTTFRQFWATQASKDRALAAIKTFEPIYKKRVRTYLPASAPVQAPQTTPAVAPVVTNAFPKDVTVWQTSADVRRLQTVLKDEGYFGTLSPTGFFWPTTKAAMIKFSTEVLKVSNPDWNLSGKVRDAMNARLSSQ